MAEQQQVLDRLFRHARNAEVDAVRALVLEGGVDLTTKNEQGHTLLIVLCYGAAPEVVARDGREYSQDDAVATGLLLLRSAPALLWTPDAQGRLPLHWAVATSRLHLVLLLIKAARELEEKEGATEEDMALAERALTGVDNAGFSPLHAGEGFVHVVTAAVVASGKDGEPLPGSAAGSGLLHGPTTQPSAPTAAGAAAPSADAGEGTTCAAASGGHHHQQQQQRRRRGRGGGGGGSGTAVPQLKCDEELLAYTQSYGFPGWVGTEGRCSQPDGTWLRRWEGTVLTSNGVAQFVGLYAALSGAGALMSQPVRPMIVSHAGLNLVLRDARALLLGEEGGACAEMDAGGKKQLTPYAPRGRLTPAGRRARLGAAEHAANVCHEIMSMRRAAMTAGGGGARRRGARGGGGGGQDERKLVAWLDGFWWPNSWVPRLAGPGGRGLSDAALAFVVEHHLLDPATSPFSVGTWASILGEAVALALHAVGGSAAALVGPAGGLYPSLAFASPLWPTLLGALGKLGRCLCFGLIGQREGADGEVLTQREEKLFEDLLDAALRLLVPLAGGMGVEGAGDGAAAIRRLTEPYLAPVWRLMEDALASVDGMVEEPTRFAVLTRAYLGWSMATCSLALSPPPSSSSSSSSSYHKHVQAIVASCAPKLAGVPAPSEGAAKGKEEMEAMIRAFRQFNKAPLLKTLAAAATLPTTHDPTTTTNPPPPRRNRNNRGRHQRGVQHQAAGGSAGLPFPPEFEAFVARARHGLNRVLRGLPDALTGPLAMLLRLPGAVETANKLEHVVVQLERQTNESFTLVWNRFLLDEAEALEMVVAQVAAADRQSLARASLSVTLEGEPGIGDGPLRELLDALRPLFAPERPPAFHATPSGGLLARHLPLFRRLEHQGDADAVAPRPAPSPTMSRRPSPPALQSGPTSREEEKGGEAASAAVGSSSGGNGDGDGGGSKPAAILSSEAEEEVREAKEDGERRRLLLRAAGRVLGFALRNGMPLGVVLPPAVCRALLDLDDPAVPKQQLALPPPPVVAVKGDGDGERGQEQQPHQEAGRAAGGGGGGQGRNNPNNRRRRRGVKGGKTAVSEEGKQQQQQQQQQQQPQPPQSKQPPSASPAARSSIAVPVGRWREYVGEDDPVLLRSLEAVLAHDFGKAGPDDPLADTRFVVTEEEGDGSGGVNMREVDLVPGGGRLRVSNANKRAFVALVARRRLLRGAEPELRALKQGLLDVIPARFLALFSPSELSYILSGPRGPIDFTELRRLVQYERGLGAHSPVVQMLWECVTHELSLEEQRLFLLFWSGSRTPPALGFGQRADDEFAWTISRLTGPGVSPNSLPETSTCDRRLSLPEYKTAAQLKAKLLAAITHGCVGYDRV